MAIKGSGTPVDPYLLGSQADLAELANDPTACYEMISDISLSTSIIPLPEFSGVLDGKGFDILGLEIEDTPITEDYLYGTQTCGFFRAIRGPGVVKNLRIFTTEVGVVGSTGRYTGVLTGHFSHDEISFLPPTVHSVVVVGTVSREDQVGGLYGGMGVDNPNQYCPALISEVATFVKLVNSENIASSNDHRHGPMGSFSYANLALFNRVVASQELFYSTQSGLIEPYKRDYVGTESNPSNYQPTITEDSLLTISQISDQTLYTGWDFEKKWEMVDGYPKLRQPEAAEAQSSKVSGIVQIDGTPAERQVRAFGYDPTNHAIDGENVSQSKSLGHSSSEPDTGAYTIDLLAGYAKEIFVVAFDDYGDAFTAEQALTVGDRIHPTTPNGHVWETTGAGTLPAEEPIWVVDTETSQLYGTAAMIARPFYRPMVHGPITPEVTELDPVP